MNTKLAIGLLGFLILIGVSVYFIINMRTDINSQSSTANNQKNKLVENDSLVEQEMTNQTEESVQITADSSETMFEGYQEYSLTAFESSKDKERIYFFHASWCSTCREADNAITSAVDQIPENVVIFKTDYDKELDLKKKYGITYQHTFVLVDENGEKIKTWNGGGIEEILKNI